MQQDQNSTTWQKIIEEEKNQPYFKNIFEQLSILRKRGETIYPEEHQIFNAFELTPFSKVKVVILGQDPYHGPGQAHGLCFSVPKNIPLPPSLQNIFKALNNDIGADIPKHGSLEKWAKQGVFLLNTVLSVTKGTAGSHSNIGWQQFTDKIISKINSKKTPIVYLLWGAHAQKKSHLINNPLHKVLQAPHPSPLSAYRGFLTCSCFSQANKWLCDNKKTPILW